MEGLILRLDAPLMSFGGVRVDQHNITDRFPGLSLMAGLIANALGWHHADMARIQHLQDRLLLASRWDVAPTPLVDYHTVDLGQAKMREAGWTTRGAPEHRDGGAAAKYGTHRRYRHYWCNGVLTAVLALRNGEQPDISTIAKALEQPARPLFIGRKTCLPAARIFIGRITGDTLFTMLAAVPRATRRHVSDTGAMPARWPVETSTESSEQVRQIFDIRDWKNQLHAGSRSVAEGLIPEVCECS